MAQIIARLAVCILLALPIFVFFYDSLVLGFLRTKNYAEDTTKITITQGQSTVIFITMFAMMLVGAVFGSAYERYMSSDREEFEPAMEKFFNTPALRILRQFNQICIMVALAIVAIFYLLREYATVFHLNFGDEEEVVVTAATEKKPRNTK
ncbi:hypothetical protein CAEBREN_24148 [Caenorhabditis brenneri]|uniref:Uncharacterized protein n=1 Tax=Caenorhabditis brenneri TaxID=135651 RepID=G0P444_CAEBE|nr:hypothetical protein CAEBREN_24148 [Caenorhabditis brenneri]